MEYDLKNDLLIYKIDSLTQKGGNDFILKVTDERGNVSEFKGYFVR
jgi:hypothetical protein